MSTLQESAEKYGISTARQFFPVNSLRLLYFFISGYFTKEDPQVIEKVGSLIPLIEAVFSARIQHRGKSPDATVQNDFTAVTAPLSEIYKVVDTPVVRHIFGQLFSYIYPLQDDLFLSVYQDMVADRPHDAHHLQSLLRIRAMDSIIFSTVISEIIHPDYYSPAVHFHINLAYQINDLVDTVVFAKDDLESKAFSPFQVIQKIAPEPTAAKELIKNVLDDLLKKATTFAFPEMLQEEVVKYYLELVEVIKGN